MYIVHLKPDQPEAMPVRINEWRVGPQNWHQALYVHPVHLDGLDFRFVNLITFMNKFFLIHGRTFLLNV